MAELHFYQLLGVDGPVPVSRKKKKKKFHKMICTCTFYAVSYWTLAKKIGVPEATEIFPKLRSSRSVTFLYGSGFADPYQWFTDPDYVEKKNFFSRAIQRFFAQVFSAYYLPGTVIYISLQR
jgi:hypothetical protein